MRLLFILLIALSSNVFALENEDYYTKHWCLNPSNNPLNEKGLNEVILEDRSRVDCLMEDYAIEFDWANKFKSGVGQALNYSIETMRRPGIVLIMRKESDEKYWDRLQEMILKFNLPIQTWKMVVY